MEGGKARGWGAVPIPGILNTPWGQAELRLGFMVQRSSSWTPCVVVVAMGTGGDSNFCPPGPNLALAALLEMGASCRQFYFFRV